MVYQRRGRLILNRHVRTQGENAVISMTDFWKVSWYKGDLILANKNFQDEGIYNGDVGEVVEISGSTWDNGSLSCKFGDNIIRIAAGPRQIDVDDDDEEMTTRSFRLAWCRTTHKTQGDEYEIVIYHVPKVGKFYTANFRNAFTAISRAKEICICVSPTIDILKAAINHRSDLRIDNLTLTYRKFETECTAKREKRISPSDE